MALKVPDFIHRTLCLHFRRFTWQKSSSIQYAVTNEGGSSGKVPCEKTEANSNVFFEEKNAQLQLAKEQISSQGQKLADLSAKLKSEGKEKKIISGTRWNI